MKPEALADALTNDLRADLQLGTLEGDAALVLTLSYAGTTICTSKCVLPDVNTVPRADCPHPHSSADAVRTALLGVVADLRRAAKACGDEARAAALNDAATYVEEGHWPADAYRNDTDKENP